MNLQTEIFVHEFCIALFQRTFTLHFQVFGKFPGGFLQKFLQASY